MTAPLSKRYSLRLKRLTIGRSHRVSRFYGSRRVVSVSIPEEILCPGNQLVEFFSRSFVLCGKVFQAIYAKEATVYLIETGDFTPSLPSGAATMRTSHLSAKGRLSFAEFIAWHNPLKSNVNQVCSSFRYY